MNVAGRAHTKAAFAFGLAGELFLSQAISPRQRGDRGSVITDGKPKIVELFCASSS